MNLDHITPRNDVAFKMIFTDPKHERLLIHFLNCTIEAKDPIKSAKILNGEITKRHVSQKGSRLDIRAETNSGEIVDIEIQVGRDEHISLLLVRAVRRIACCRRSLRETAPDDLD